MGLVVLRNCKYIFTSICTVCLLRLGLENGRGELASLKENVILAPPLSMKSALSCGKKWFVNGLLIAENQLGIWCKTRGQGEM